MNEPPWLRAATRAERATGDATAPPWWEHVASILAPGTSPSIRDRDDATDADTVRGALRLVAPFVRSAQRELRAHPSAGEAAVRSLTKALAEELIELTRPAVTLDLVAARFAGGWEDGELERESAAHLRELGRAEGARALLDAHPGLARMLADRTRLACDASCELMDRVAADLPRVRDAVLGGEDPGAVTALDLAGDAHDGGRRVARVRFEHGACAVIKPRSMTADAAFANLLTALSELGFEPRFAPLATFEAGPRHGWQAWAQPATCTSRAELTRYFRRLGGQLAILHSLQATDMHQENVLACGEHPMLVDLETVLHPRLGGARAVVVDPLIAETGLDCVLRVGLLPRADVAFGVDISGLGRDPEGEHLAEQVEWAGTGADARLVARRLRLEPGDNAPRLDGRAVRPQEHVDALAAGFGDAWDLLARNHARLLAPGGALDAFGGATTRVVLRPTKVYADLVRRQSRDLATLDDGHAREDALGVLWRGAQRRPELRVAAPAEFHDLWLGDVPKITTTPGSFDGAHHALGALPGMLRPRRAPSPEIVRRLDDRDRERQLSFLRSSVLAAAQGAGADADAVARSVPAGSAQQVGDRLAILALHDDEDATAGWLAPVAVPPAGARVLRPVGSDLRHGQAGIALLLGLLQERVTGVPVGGCPGTLVAKAGRRLGMQLAAAGELDDEHRGGALFVLSRLRDVPGHGELVRSLAARRGAASPAGTAWLVLGLAATAGPRDTRSRRDAAAPCHAELRDRLEAVASELAGAPPTILAALALAAAAACLPGEAGPLLAGAAATAARALAGRSALVRVAGLAAATRATRAVGVDGATGADGTAAPPVGDLREELVEAVASLGSGDLAGAGVTARRFAAPAVLCAAAAALGGRSGAPALDRARRLRDELAAVPPSFQGGAESPTLEDGLAGIGLGWLALDANATAIDTLIAVWAAREDAQLAAAESSARRSSSPSAKP